ncbi:hypothetical protein ACFE04_000580 [Oxalis oulophora]
MCEGCLLSFATEKETDCDTYKSVIGILHKDLELLVDEYDDQIRKFNWLYLEEKAITACLYAKPKSSELSYDRAPSLRRRPSNMIVCPLCAANLGKDPTGHFIVQHASSLKRRTRYPKSGSFPSNLPVLGQELSSFLGSSTNDKGSEREFVPDHLLPPFLCSTIASGPKNNQHHEYSSSNASVTASLQSAKQSQWDEVQEQNNEEKRMKAEFVQGLMESTLFLDFRST